MEQSAFESFSPTLKRHLNLINVLGAEEHFNPEVPERFKSRGAEYVWNVYRIKTHTQSK